MQSAEEHSTGWVDLDLVLRILRLVIESMKQQVKKFDPDDITGAILELGSTKELNPPFDKLHSHAQLLQTAIEPLDLFETVDEKWTLDIVEKTIQKMKEWNLIYEIELNGSQYAEPTKVIAQPLGLIIFQKIVGMAPLGTPRGISIREFEEKWLNQSHRRHSEYVLEAFQRRLRMSVSRSERLSQFNISVTLLLLMYGAVRRERALKIKVDPTESIDLYQDIIANELKRIGRRVLNHDPLNKGTLLDKIQGTNKIKRILNDPDLYIRYKGKASDGHTQYSLFFNIGSEDIRRPPALSKLDDILQAVISNARSKNANAPELITALFDEHVNGINTNDIVQPVHIRTLFGGSPSVQYLRLLHERAQYVVDQLEDYSDGGS